VADGIFEARHSTTIGQPIRSPVAKLIRLRIAEFERHTASRRANNSTDQLQKES